MISKHTVERLIIYNRVLKDLFSRGEMWATSNRIARILSKTSAQVRRDLSFLGKKGKTGVGYNIKGLINDLDRVLGLKNTWAVMLVGAGNLGRALFFYPGFKREGFEFKAIIDNDPKKIGRKWGGTKIDSLKDLKKMAMQKKINIAIIAVPENAAQDVADSLLQAKVEEILNFAPVALSVPKNVNVRHADLALELVNLSYLCKNK
jgi:redox-sensing transcriptional repressor